MNLKLNRAIRRILMASAATALTAGTMGLAHAITAGVQIQPPGPNQVPDYFGVSSNYATSPTPNFALVTITDVANGGTGAVAAATTVDYLNPNYGLTPTGTYSGNLMDVELVSGGTGYTSATTVTVNGFKAGAATSATLTPIIVNGVIAGFQEIPHGDITQPIVDANGNPVLDVNGNPTFTMVSPAWSKDATTGQWIVSGAGTATPVYWSGLQFDKTNTAVNGKFTQPIPGTGIRKFVNDIAPLHLPGTPAVINNLGQSLEVADASASGAPFGAASDYYEIAEVAYTQQLHSDLPPTHLRGYIQLVPSTYTGAKTDITTVASIQLDPAIKSQAGKYYMLGTNPSFLGPVIIAQKNKAVRMKVVNLLPSGDAGKLPFPVDHTYMGAGNQTNVDGSTSGLLLTEQPDNRTSVHLHGGTTPWISDGTPRQWFTPAAETNGPNRGVSATDVPDMWYVNGVLDTTPGCQGQTDPSKCAAGATNNPGAGALTFFYTNEESARLMFYHDHAEGITRLNVYGGLAAGYILQDPTEQAMTVGSVAANTNKVTYGNSPTPVAYNEVLPADVIPLVIQEKTFLPDNTKPVMTFYGPFRSQLNAQDPTWRWGSNGTSFDGITGTFVPYGQFAGTTTVPATASRLAGVTYANGPGDLWVPHVYMTNQNPGDASGANPQGRWDYGSWFWPPATVIDHPQVTNPYYDSNCTSATLANPDTSNPVGTCEFQYIPAFPNGGQMPSNTQSASCTYAQNGKGTSIKSCQGLGFVSQEELDAMSQPSGTPEAFNDTPLVNGTVYPFINVEPKKYRLRLLSAGNDRTWNLSLWVASSKGVDTTSDGVVGGVSPAAAAGQTCDGSNGSPSPDQCTEVRMVPWDGTQDKTSHFPTWWYSKLKGGITFDGRPGGVPDPLVRGPAMVQIGTEGGFLAEPAVIKNQPVNFEYNVKNILVTNVKEHALLLGAAERADVVVDFSKFAGSTLIMYNDAPAALPAFDLRLDYYTGNFDNTDTGGNFQTLPGYGPNSRTIMQFRVGTTVNGGSTVAPAASDPASRDYVDSNYLTSLTNEIHKAFALSQEPVVVPQNVHNNIYKFVDGKNKSVNVADEVSSNLSAIGDTTVSFKPIASVHPVTGVATLEDLPITMELAPKAIQELFTLDYGRMNATLGTEIPNTSATTQTTIPMGYVEPPTELVQMTNGDPNAAVQIGQLADGTQIWKITHNGVDTHPIHFHLFSVQLINRVGWDGAIYNPEPNETGWKEVLRMNPLSDVIVALRPKTLTLPFKLGNSHHIADATQPIGSAFNQPNLDPTTGGGSNVTNQINNYGWEYVWHCHILGHEENDFMRSIAVAQVPEAPSNLVVTPNATTNNNDLTWTDNSVNSNWVTIQRSSDPLFPAATTASFNVANPVGTVDAASGVVTLTSSGYNQYGECTKQAGCALTWSDTSVPGGDSYYRVVAHSTVGTGDFYAKLPKDLTKTSMMPNAGAGFQGYDNVTADSDPSNTSAKTTKTLPSIAIIAPTGNTIVPPGNAASYDFGNQVINIPANKLPSQIFTVKNVGNANLSIGRVNLQNGNVFTIPNNGNTCPATLAPNATCSITVRFRPTVVGAATDTLTITDNNGGVASSSQSVTLNGNGINGAYGVFSPSPVDFGTTYVGSVSAAKTITLTNLGGLPLQFNTANIISSLPGTFVVNGTGPSGCMSKSGPKKLAANGGSCTLSVQFQPTANQAYNGTLSIVDNSNMVSSAVTTQTLAMTGFGGTPPTATLAGVTNWTNPIINTTTSHTFTLTNTTASSINLTAAAVSLTGSNRFSLVTGNTCDNASLAANTAASGQPSNGGTCSVTVSFTPNNTTARTATLSVALPNGGATQTLNLSGTGVYPVSIVKSAGSVGTVTQISATAGSDAFGNQNGNVTNTITFTNNTSGSVVLGTVGITGAAAFTSNNATGPGICSTGATIAAGASCTYVVNFAAPAGINVRAGTLTVPYTPQGAAATSLSIVLSGS